MVRRSAVAFATLLLMAIAAVPGSGAENAPPAVIVLDGSGSMWGRLGAAETPKIEAVRSAVAALAAQAPRRDQIALVAFGHRRRGDCADVETVAPLSAAGETFGKLAAVEPKGKGPLALAVQQGAELLPADAPGAVVVIHDGADNCQRDICEAVRVATTARPRAQFRFIGLSLPRPEALKHACLAELDNVTIVPADTEAALATALATAFPTEPAAAVANEKPAPDAAIEMSATLAEGGAAMTTPLRWRIFKTGAADPIAQSTAPTFTGRLDPGDYDVDVAVDLVIKRASVTVGDDGRLRATIVLNAGAAVLETGTAASGKPRPELMSIYRRDTEATGTPWRPLLAEIDLRRSFYLPEGDYKLRITGQGAHRDIPFSVAAGQTATIDLPPPPGEVVVEILGGQGADGTALLISEPSISVMTDDPSNTEGAREILRSAAARARFSLAPGTYVIAARNGDAEMRQTIAIEAGAAQTLQLAPPAAVVEFASNFDADGAATAPNGLTPAIDIEPLDPTAGSNRRIHATDGRLHLAPGRYRLSAKFGPANVVSLTEIALTAGTTTRTTFNLASGEVRLSLAPATNAFAGTPVWRIFDDQDRAVWQGVARTPNVLLLPGSYSVTADIRSTRYATTFEARQGETTDVELATR